MIRDAASFTVLLTLLFHSAKKLIYFGSLVWWNLKYLKFLQHDLLFMPILHGIQRKIAIKLVLFCLKALHAP